MSSNGTSNEKNKVMRENRPLKSDEVMPGVTAEDYRLIELARKDKIMAEPGEIIDVPTGTELLAVDPSAPPEIVGLYPNDPLAMVELATAQAQQLSKIIDDQKLFTMIRKKKHVSIEGWTLLGSMLGVFPIVEWTRELFDSEGESLGWEARVEARNIQGQVVGAAEAECRYGEDTWKTRQSYALKSMAQTRAASKALRLPLGFVMSLAGYDATPTEEFDRTHIAQAKTEVMALVGGDKIQAKLLWNRVLEEHDLGSDDEVKPEHIESFLNTIADWVEPTNEEGDDMNDD